MYQFIDTHCHFDFPPFAGTEVTSLASAQAAGVNAIIVPAVVADYFPRVLALARCYVPVYAALGLHPLMMDKHSEQSLQTLDDQLRLAPDKLVAVGEIGLDLFIPKPDLPRQQALLEAQFRLAKRYNLPVILHSRRSHDQLASLLRRHNLPATGVVHGFAGSLQQAMTFVKLGYKIGVGGTISWSRAAKTRAVMAQLPLTSLLLETDAPDMPLYGWQGQANRPERVADVFAVLCQLRHEPAPQIASTLLDNARQLFCLT